MSDLIINFGSQIVPCSKLAENFYFGSIKFKDIHNIKTCFRDFDKYPISEIEVSNYCNKLLKCLENGTLKPTTLTLQASEFYYQAENVLFVNKLEVDCQKIVLVKSSEKCVSTEMCVPFVLELYDKSKIYESVESIVDSKTLQFTNEKMNLFNTLLSKSCLVSEFYNMLKNRYFYNSENQITEVLMYYITQRDLPEDTLYKHIDTLLENNIFKEYFSKCGELDSPTVSELKNLTNNVIMFVFKFVAVSKENSKTNLKFITSQFMDKIFVEIAYPKSKTEINNIVKSICDNELAVLNSIYNKDFYNLDQKIEFLKYLSNENPKKLYTVLNVQSKCFEELSRFENKLQKDLLEFSIDEISKVLKHFNSSITTLEKYKALIKKYFEWGKNKGLIDVSKTINISDLKKEKFINPQIKTSSKFLLTENDYVSAMERMYYHSNDLKIKQFIISFFLNSSGVSKDNLRIATLFNYQDILKDGLSIKIKDQTFNMKTILNGGLNLCEYFIENDRDNEYHLKDTDYLIFANTINNTTKNTHFPSVLTDLNQNNVIPYSIEPRAITPSNLRQCVKFMAFEQYLIKNNLDVYSTNTDIKAKIVSAYKELFNVKDSVTNALVFSGYINARFVNEFLNFKNNINIQ